MRFWDTLGKYRGKRGGDAERGGVGKRGGGGAQKKAHITCLACKVCGAGMERYIY